MRIVISYDISDDKRRTKVAKIMEGHGYRVQYSVFECDLDDAQLKKLWQRLKPLVSPQNGESIRFYPLHRECAEKAKVLGTDHVRFLDHTQVV